MGTTERHYGLERKDAMTPKPSNAVYRGSQRSLRQRKLQYQSETSPFLVARFFGVPLREEVGDLVLSQDREKCRSLDACVGGFHTRRGGVRHTIQRQRRNRNESRTLELSIGRSPTRTKREAEQSLTSGSLCVSEYFAIGKWAWREIADLPGFPNVCQRSKKSYPLYVAGGGA
jgi:hypothetical protein